MDNDELTGALSEELLTIISSVTSLFKLLYEEVKERKRAEIRDRFAMAALTGLLSARNQDGPHIVRTAYDYADAMLEERKK